MGYNHSNIHLGWRFNGSFLYDDLYFYWHSGVGVVRLFIVGSTNDFRSRVYKISSN